MSRVPLPVLPGPPPPRVECTSCGKCCTYVSVGINAPRNVRFASDVLWYLYHDKVTVYRDGDGDWSVIFETRCRQLGSDLRCGVYADRPVICREFDDTTCEVNAPGGALSFSDPETFLRYMQGWRPQVFGRLMKGYVPPGLAQALDGPVRPTDSRSRAPRGAGSRTRPPG